MCRIKNFVSIRISQEIDYFTHTHAWQYMKSCIHARARAHDFIYFIYIYIYIYTHTYYIYYVHENVNKIY